MELNINMQREDTLRARRQMQIELLSERMDAQANARLAAHNLSHIEVEALRRVKKKLAIFYTILLLIISGFVTLTVLYWDDSENEKNEWTDVYAKICPTLILVLFMLFNVWI